MNNMQIRRLTPDDAATYRALRLRALREHPDAFTSSHTEEGQRPVEDSAWRLATKMFWGAWDGDSLVGMVGLEREARTKNRHKATVVGMYVAAECAGAGLGRRLFDALLTQAQHDGIGMLVLTVTDGNANATHLYESLGFRSFGVEPRAINVDGRYFGKNHMFLDLTGLPS
ncbi:MAG TPA: GNAT family N-acetyltransferase [Ramlibacter sp.]